MLWEEIMKPTSYTKKYFLRDFTEKEILSGLELALSEPKDQIRERRVQMICAQKIFLIFPENRFPF